MKWRHRIFAGLLIVLMLPVVCVIGLYASAWYHRWRAGGLVSVLRNVQPGVTTREEYLKIVEPFDNHLLRVGEADHLVYSPGAIGIENWPGLPKKVFDLVFVPITYLADHRLVPYAVDFFVIPSFQEGVVSSLSVEEMQGSGHPFNGNTTLIARRFEHEDDPIFDERFAGYSVQQMRLGDGTLWESFVKLDERATSVERQRALDFHFWCFTKRGDCRDGGKMLQPAPNRPGYEDTR
jgi:hypothetical protein